jgi:hypothetical protein
LYRPFVAKRHFKISKTVHFFLQIDFLGTIQISRPIFTVFVDL